MQWLCQFDSAHQVLPALLIHSQQCRALQQTAEQSHSLKCQIHWGCRSPFSNDGVMPKVHYFNLLWICCAFSASTWLGARKSIWPVKIEWWGVDVVICLERGAGRLHMVQLMPLPSRKPHHLLPHPYWFYLSGTGLPMLSMFYVSIRSLLILLFSKWGPFV